MRLSFAVLISAGPTGVGCGAPTAPELRAHNNRSPRGKEDKDDTETGETGEQLPEPKAELRRPQPLIPPKPVVEFESCDEGTAAYLELRERLDHCRRDDDCAEISEGLCPHGPVYADRYADPEALWAWEEALSERCPSPTCKPGEPLGIAHCERHRCVPGREPPGASKPDRPRCYDIPVTFLEPQVRTYFRVETEAVDGPRLGLGMARKGHIKLFVDWRGCPDCSLELSRLHPVAGLSVPARRIRKGPHETIDIAASRSTYYLRFSPGPKAGKGRIRIRAQVETEGGDAMATRQHGKVWVRRCERAEFEPGLLKPGTIQRGFSPRSPSGGTTGGHKPGGPKPGGTTPTPTDPGHGTSSTLRGPS